MSTKELYIDKSLQKWRVLSYSSTNDGYCLTLIDLGTTYIITYNEFIFYEKFSDVHFFSLRKK